eukprot:CAMPEP_0185775840 /NCGR_PEP_ID=MMETSP1174-20130828/83458_1 /TAXON_ID=35687 /ORGANISM="Dictyocha speculum, Strain CCMP1381" /LENGTH=198 /DNA_ID=CAMNT_0028463539 /DNA_START=120 /DNA_END=716 /DNA_ORIENTATION=+
MTTTQCVLLLSENYGTVISDTTFEAKINGIDGTSKLFLGHTISDLIWVLLYFTGQPDEIGFLLHHVAIIIVWTISLDQDFAHVFALVCMICEGTGPFLAFNWIMKQCDMRSSLLFYANGVVIFLLWWVLRIGGYVTFLGSKWAAYFFNNGVIDGRTLLVLMLWVLGAGLQLWWGQKITSTTVSGIKAAFLSKKPDKIE